MHESVLGVVFQVIDNATLEIFMIFVSRMVAVLQEQRQSKWGMKHTTSKHFRYILIKHEIQYFLHCCPCKYRSNYQVLFARCSVFCSSTWMWLLRKCVKAYAGNTVSERILQRKVFKPLRWVPVNSGLQIRFWWLYSSVLVRWQWPADKSAAVSVMKDRWKTVF